MQAAALGDAMTTRRHHAAQGRVGDHGKTVLYDPRFLVYEFTCDLMLRDQQVGLSLFVMLSRRPTLSL